MDRREGESAGFQRTERICHPEGRCRPLTACLRRCLRGRVSNERRFLLPRSKTLVRRGLYDAMDVVRLLQLALCPMRNEMWCREEGQRNRADRKSLSEGYAALVSMRRNRARRFTPVAQGSIGLVY